MFNMTVQVSEICCECMSVHKPFYILLNKRCTEISNINMFGSSTNGPDHITKNRIALSARLNTCH